MSDCTALQFAIISKSEDKVTSIVQRNRDSVFRTNLHGQSPLHTACSWPWAMEMLLSNGSDPASPDDFGIIPLAYACANGSLGSARLLIEFGSPLSYENEWDELKPALSADFVEECELDRGILAFFVATLARRRAQLLDHARDKLPPGLFSQLTSTLGTDTSLPDTEAFDLIKALRERGDMTNRHHWCYTPMSVYQYIGFREDFANALFESGFRNLECMRGGFYSLLCSDFRDLDQGSVNFARKVLWLWGRDVSYLKPLATITIARRRIPVISLIAIMIYDIEDIADWPQSDTEDVQLLFGLFLNKEYDNPHVFCRCRCSLNGCISSTMLLKRLFYTSANYVLWRWLHKFLRSIDNVFALLMKEEYQQQKKSFEKAAVRMCVFEALELTHTCCRIDYSEKPIPLRPPIDSQNAADIQDEEATVYEIFNDLLPQANREWAQSSKPFSQFFVQFYEENIQIRAEVHEQEEYCRKARGIGVHFEPPSDEDNEKNSDEDTDTEEDNSGGNNAIGDRSDEEDEDAIERARGDEEADGV